MMGMLGMPGLSGLPGLPTSGLPVRYPARPSATSPSSFHLTPSPTSLRYPMSCARQRAPF